MPIRRRSPKVTKASRRPPKPPSAPSPAEAPPVVDVVRTLRSGPFAPHPELSDTVLRSIASKASNTRRSILANYAVWKAWCAERVRKPYPAHPRDVAAFLQAHAPPIHVTKQGGFELRDLEITPTGGVPKKYATLARYLGTLSKLHVDGGYPDPTKDPEVLAVWRVLRRGLPRPAQKAAFHFEAVCQALTALPDTLTGKRDRALLLLAYTLMARRSELVALNVGDFDVHPDGSATVTFERHKTGEQATSYLPPAIMGVVQTWWEAAPIRKGAVFIRLDAAGTGKRDRLTAQSVALVFKRIAKDLNLPDLDPMRVSSHSARIGATNDLVEDGAPDAAIMRDAGWKTPRMVGLYSRGAKARNGAMATRLLLVEVPVRVSQQTLAQDADAPTVINFNGSPGEAVFPSNRPAGKLR
jgi:integrase